MTSGKILKNEMEEEIKNKIPRLPTYEESGIEEIRPYLLDARENYPEPFYLLEYNGVPFSALGGIQALSGQKKNGKTFVLAQLMAVILGGDCARVKANLPGLKVPERTIEKLGHQPTVLYVDTEMERLNSAKVLRRVHWLCEWPMDEPNERFHVLWLRTIAKDENMPAHKKRLRLIRMAIDILHPDAVFIDGIRDIIGDFNDNAQSAELITDLMALAEQKQICIWNVLHMNPRPGNDDDSKMRGHLGTELGNKVTDTLASIKKKTNSGVTFTVKQLDARSKDMEDWTFEVTEQAGALGVPRIISGATPKQDKIEADSSEDILKWISAGKDKYDWPLTRSDIKKYIFCEIGGQKNSTKQQLDLQAAINLGYLEESIVKAANGSYMLQPPDVLPF